MGKISTPATIVAYRGARTLRLLALSVGFATLATWLAFRPSTDLVRRWILGFGAAFFAAGAFVLARQYFGVGPALILDDSGVQAPRWYEGKVAWQAIADIEREVVKGSDFLTLRLTDEGAAAVRPRAFIFLTPQRKSLVVSLSSLQGSPDAIAAEIVGRWLSKRPIVAATGPILGVAAVSFFAAAASALDPILKLRGLL